MPRPCTTYRAYCKGVSVGGRGEGGVASGKRRLHAKLAWAYLGDYCLRVADTFFGLPQLLTLSYKPCTVRSASGLGVRVIPVRVLSGSHRMIVVIRRRALLRGGLLIRIQLSFAFFTKPITIIHSDLRTTTKAVRRRDTVRTRNIVPGASTAAPWLYQ